MPQREDLCSTYRYTAEGAVTQFAVLVEGTADKQATLPGGANVGNIIGIALHAAADGEEVEVAEAGSYCRAIANAAISRGAMLAIAGTSGNVLTAAPGAGTNTFLVGQAKSAAAASGDHVFIHINPSVMQG